MLKRCYPHFFSLYLRFYVGLVLAGALSASLSAAAQESLSDADRGAIRTVIQAQLDAFRADDAVLAFSFASPAIQAQFGDPQNFMAMVKSGYQPVYRPRSVLFEEIVEAEGKIVQQVLIMDAEGRSVMAMYPMAKQDDGSWRIDGCYLVPSKAQML